MTGRPRRPPSPSVWKGAVITGLCVAIGAVLGPATLPAPPTPGNVAKTYVEARYARDWNRAWGLMCSRTRSAFGQLSGG